VNNPEGLAKQRVAWGLDDARRPDQAEPKPLPGPEPSSGKSPDSFTTQARLFTQPP
jgi:hypothetical protein